MPEQLRDSESWPVAESKLRWRVGLLCLMVILGAWGCGSPTNEVGARVQVVDSRRGAGAFCSIAADGNAVVVGYSGPTADSGPIRTGGVYLARSTDGGATFDADEIVTIDSEGSVVGDVAITGRAVFVSYRRNTDIYFARSEDGGQTFSIEMVSNDASFAASILVSGSTLDLVYPSWSSPGVHFRRSEDGGASWSSPVAIFTGAGVVRTLSIGAAGGVLYASFYSDGQHTAHSADSGDTWVVEQSQELLATGSLVTSGDSVLLPLVDRDDQVFVGESRNSGATWTLHPFAVPGGAYGDNPLDDLAADSTIAGARLAISDATTYAIFNQGSDSDSRLGFARSTDRGAEWPAATVSTAYASLISPFPTVDADIAISMATVTSLLIAFFDGDHLRVLRSTDDGRTWL